MRLLLLLLTLLLGGCSTTQTLAPLDQETAEAAVIAVLRLGAENIDAEAFSSLPIEALLDESSAHLPDQTQIPLFSSRLERWHSSVLLAYWQAAGVLTAELDGLLATLDLSDAPAIVSSSDLLATGVLASQHFDTMRSIIAEPLREALTQSTLEWQLLSARYEIVRASEKRALGRILPPVSADLTEHLINTFIEHYLGSLAIEEQLLRTTAVQKGSGSILEVFQ